DRAGNASPGPGRPRPQTRAWAGSGSAASDRPPAHHQPVELRVRREAGGGRTPPGTRPPRARPRRGRAGRTRASWLVPGSRGAEPRDGRPWGSFTRAGSVERDALATGPGHEGDDGRGRGRVPQEADAPVAEQGVRSAGVPRVDLVVAGRVDHARSE